MIVTDSRSPHGYFLNPNGYDDSERWTVPYMAPETWRGWPFRKTMYLFQLHRTRPLTFVMADGTRVQPDRKFITDWGSTPKLLQIIAPAQEYPGYPLHDCAFRVGLWHAHPIRDGEGNPILDARTGHAKLTPYTFTPYTFMEANRLLRLSILACGATAARADMIHGVVSTAGLAAWMMAAKEREIAQRRKLVERARAAAGASQNKE